METYQHSGRFSASGLLFYACIMLLLGVIGGAVYCAAVVFLPFIKLRAVVAAVMAVGFGVASGSLAERAKIRNRPVVWLVTFGSMAVFYYVSWGLHPLFVVAQSEGFGAAFNDIGFHGFLPWVLFGWTEQLFDSGLWQVGRNGGALAGWALVMVWLIEAGILFITSVTMANQTFGKRPFCEDCNEWTNIELNIAVLPVRGDDPAWKKVSAGELDAIRKLAIVPDNGHFVRLDLATCPQCERSDYLTGVTIHVVETAKETKTQETPIFSYLHLPRQKTQEIREFASQMAEAVNLLSEPDQDNEHA